MATYRRTSKLIPLVVIVGPTASGKSDWVNTIAKKHDGEVVNADSRQVYKELAIGTNKEPGEWKIAENKPQYVVDGIIYHLIDFVAPDAHFSVYEYQKHAHEAIRDIHKRERLACISGGTAMYVDAVVHNWKLTKESFDAGLRNELVRLTNIELLRRLESHDKDLAKRIDPHNTIHLIRAIEIFELTGEIKGAAPKKGEPLYEACKIGISTDREKLYAKIQRRVDQQIRNGLVEEVEHLIKKYSKDLPALNSIGYKEIVEYLDGEVTKEQAIENIKTHTRRYAKRQMTWWKRDTSIAWFSDLREAERHLRLFLQL